MDSKKRAVVAGLICLDIIPNLDRVLPGKFFDLFKPGFMIQTGSPVLSTGGSVSNTGLAMHILGIETNLMGKIGNDMFGKTILDLLQKHGPNLINGMIIDPNASSSFTIIISPPGIDRLFLHHPGANDTFCIEDIHFETIKNTSIFHFGYPPVMERIFTEDGNQLTQIFKRAKEMGVTTSLDMCFPDPNSGGGQADWNKILSNTLPFVDIFLPSIEELLFITRRLTYFEIQRSSEITFLDYITAEDLHDITNNLMEMGAKIVLLKLGERGAYLRTGNRNRISQLGCAMPVDIGQWSDQELWAPCFKVKVIGTTGSGDTTIAGFLAALLREQTPKEAVTTAVAVGACNVEAADAISGIQDWASTQKRIKAGWEQHELVINTPNWIWDELNNLWVGPGVDKQ